MGIDKKTDMLDLEPKPEEKLNRRNIYISEWDYKSTYQIIKNRTRKCRPSRRIIDQLSW